MLYNMLMGFVFVYLSMGFIKFALMMGTLPTAIGANRKLIERSLGVCPGFLHAAFFVTLGVMIQALCMWPHALAAERFSFFRTYSVRETLRDTLRGYTSMKSISK